VSEHPDIPPTVIPDVMTTCEASDSGRTFMVAPKLVVEVISSNTVTNDLHTKLDVYGAIPSITEYLVVDSQYVGATVPTR
jgi:Uma2 family endonuclease